MRGRGGCEGKRGVTGRGGVRGEEAGCEGKRGLRQDERRVGQERM